MSWEVRTMKSATSSSKPGRFCPALWKKNMARFWPLWAVFWVFWLFLAPLTLLTQDAEATLHYTDSFALSGPAYFAQITLLDLLSTAGVFSALIFGSLSAMAVFSYLYSSRSVDFFHALPVCREGLFLTSIVSGYSFLALPTLAVALATLLAEAALGCLAPGALGMWLAVMLLMEFFFFGFGVFCAMFTGHILAMPVFTGILNFLAFVVLGLLDNIFTSFVFGFSSSDGLAAAGLWLSPALRLSASLSTRPIYAADGVTFQRVAFWGLGYVLLYALVGAVLLCAALALYRRRRLEAAGDVVAVRAVRPLFQYGVGVCAALALGSVCYLLFVPALPEGVWTLLAFLLLWGAVGYFVARMLLDKSFWVFRKGWPGCLALLAALVLFTVGMEADVTGYERRVPAADRVESVTVTGITSAPYDEANASALTFTDPALIQAVTALHQSIVDTHADWPEPQISYAYQPAAKAAEVETAPLTIEVQTQSTFTVYLTYTLTNGDTLARRYSGIPVTQGLLADPSSPAARAQTLLNTPEAVEQAYFHRIGQLENLQLASVTLDVWDLTTNRYVTYPVPAEYREALMEALRADLAAGDLGRRYLLEDEARLRNCYSSDLVLEYRSTDPAEYGSRRLYITLQTTSRRSLAVLEEAGVLGDTRVLETQAQAQTRQAVSYAEVDGVPASIARAVGSDGDVYYRLADVALALSGTYAQFDFQPAEGGGVEILVGQPYSGEVLEAPSGIPQGAVTALDLSVSGGTPVRLPALSIQGEIYIGTGFFGLLGLQWDVWADGGLGLNTGA